MLKTLAALVLLIVFWGPIKPVRSVTAEILYQAGDLINADSLMIDHEPQQRP